MTGRYKNRMDSFFEPFSRLEEVTAAGPEAFRTDDRRLFRGTPVYRRGHGMGHPVDTGILTPTGWQRLGDLALGDLIIGADGRGHPVTGLFDRGELPVFTVEMSDGSSVRCDEDHLWSVTTPCRKDTGRGQRLVSTWGAVQGSGGPERQPHAFHSHGLSDSAH